MVQLNLQLRNFSGYRGSVLNEAICKTTNESFWITACYQLVQAHLSDQPFHFTVLKPWMSILTI